MRKTTLQHFQKGKCPLLPMPVGAHVDASSGLSISALYVRQPSSVKVFCRCNILRLDTKDLLKTSSLRAACEVPRCDRLAATTTDELVNASRRSRRRRVRAGEGPLIRAQRVPEPAFYAAQSAAETLSRWIARRRTLQSASRQQTDGWSALYPNTDGHVFCWLPATATRTSTTVYFDQ